MDLQGIDVERIGSVARVWLDRPEARNAFDDQMIAELRHALVDLSGSEGVRVIVLGGRGPAFCAGADLRWMEAMARYGLEENLRDAHALADLFSTLHGSPKPIVARVHGAALGGGSGLVAACDIAVAASGTRFGFPEVRLGLVPAVIAPYVLARIGESAARELFLTGEGFEAARAAEIGLIRRAVPEEDLDAAVESLVEALLAAGPRAVAEAKRLIRDVAWRPVDDLQRHTEELIAALRISSEGQEGMRAFLERRKPRWA
jgi:methylglutaconyl-CoA hydratase